MNHSHKRLCCEWLVTVFAAMVFSSASLASDPTHRFSIQRGDLATALEEFGQQSGDEILFSREDTHGKTAPAVSGDLGSNEALKRLLTGSGLLFRQVNSHTYVVEASGSAGPTSAPSGAARMQSQSNERRQGQKTESLEEVVVTGSRIPTVAGQQAQPVRSYGRETI